MDLCEAASFTSHGIAELNSLFTVAVNPDTLEHETLVENANLFAEDAAGNFYFARGHKLYQYLR
ncbi:MAG TPA: hypothetical protein VNM69_06710 [Bacillus sp. (in: firmicutes)]|nr:hypothetical protein [Bacillus sp. (in: firmicutes)]